MSSDGEICSAALPEAAGRATLPVAGTANLPTFWRSYKQAAVKAMQSDWRPTAVVFSEMLDAFLSGFGFQ